MLAKLSNVDKHRHLNTTISPWLQSGTEIEPLMYHPIEITGDVEVSDEFTEQVLFDEPELQKID